MTLTELLARDEMKQYNLKDSGDLIGAWVGDRTVAISKEAITMITENEVHIRIRTECALVDFFKHTNHVSAIIFKILW